MGRLGRFLGMQFNEDAHGEFAGHESADADLEGPPGGEVFGGGDGAEAGGHAGDAFAGGGVAEGLGHDEVGEGAGGPAGLPAVGPGEGGAPVGGGGDGVGGADVDDGEGLVEVDEAGAGFAFETEEEVPVLVPAQGVVPGHLLGEVFGEEDGGGPDACAAEVGAAVAEKVVGDGLVGVFGVVGHDVGEGGGSGDALLDAADDDGGVAGG